MSEDRTKDELPQGADRKTASSPGSSINVSHFSVGRGVLLALVGFVPFAFTGWCAVHVLSDLTGTSNQVQSQVVFLVLSLVFALVFGCLSVVLAFIPTKRAVPAVNLGFERGRAMAVLMLAAVGQGLAFLLCALAMMDSPQEPLFELGLRQMMWMAILVLGGGIGAYWLLRPRKIPYVDYAESEEAKHWRLGGMIYWNPDDPRYLVERRYGYGVTINWAFRGFNAERWSIILAVLIPWVLMSVVLILLAVSGAKGR